MSSINALHEYIQRKYPDATTNLTAPLRPEGMWSLDVDLKDKHLAIQWSSTTGFGVSSASNDSFGEGPDEVFTSLDRVQERVDGLLTTIDRTSPPIGVLLSRLRELRGLTQRELAENLGLRQATISGFER